MMARIRMALSTFLVFLFGGVIALGVLSAFMAMWGRLDAEAMIVGLVFAFAVGIGTAALSLLTLDPFSSEV